MGAYYFVIVSLDSLAFFFSPTNISCPYRHLFSWPPELCAHSQCFHGHRGVGLVGRVTGRATRLPLHADRRDGPDAPDLRTG